MEVKSNKDEMIFKKEFNGRINYSLGLSKKDKEGKYVNGYITVQFKKGVEVENQTKIKIKEAWIGFNVHEKKTFPYIFVNDFIIVEDKQENKINLKEIKYTDKDLSMFDSEEIGENIEIPF